MRFMQDLQTLADENVRLKKQISELHIICGDLRSDVKLLTQRVTSESDGKIILDPKLDPDPYGQHGINLVTRLRAMGWVE